MACLPAHPAAQKPPGPEPTAPTTAQLAGIPTAYKQVGHKHVKERWGRGGGGLSIPHQGRRSLPAFPPCRTQNIVPKSIERRRGRVGTGGPAALRLAQLSCLPAPPPTKLWA